MGVLHGSLVCAAVGETGCALLCSCAWRGGTRTISAGSMGLEDSLSSVVPPSAVSPRTRWLPPNSPLIPKSHRRPRDSAGSASTSDTAQDVVARRLDIWSSSSSLDVGGLQAPTGGKSGPTEAPAAHASPRVALNHSPVVTQHHSTLSRRIGAAGSAIVSPRSPLRSTPSRHVAAATSVSHVRRPSPHTAGHTAVVAPPTSTLRVRLDSNSINKEGTKSKATSGQAAKGRSLGSSQLDATTIAAASADFGRVGHHMGALATSTPSSSPSASPPPHHLSTSSGSVARRSRYGKSSAKLRSAARRFLDMHHVA